MTGSAAEAWNKKPDMVTMATGNNTRLLAIHMFVRDMWIAPLTASAWAKPQEVRR
jgi:hypothetical protein